MLANLCGAMKKFEAPNAFSAGKINGKIQRAEQVKVHTMFVVGKRDIEADAVSVRVHGKGNLSAKPRGEAIAEILLSIKGRCA